MVLATSLSITLCNLMFSLEKDGLVQSAGDALFDDECHRVE
jgi:hypothetical protein